MSDKVCGLYEATDWYYFCLDQITIASQLARQQTNDIYIDSIYSYTKETEFYSYSTTTYYNINGSECYSQLCSQLQLINNFSIQLQLDKNSSKIIYWTFVKYTKSLSRFLTLYLRTAHLNVTKLIKPITTTTEYNPIAKPLYCLLSQQSQGSSRQQLLNVLNKLLSKKANTTNSKAPINTANPSVKNRHPMSSPFM